MIRLLSILLLIGFIMPESVRLCWRLGRAMEIEMPDHFMPVWPIEVEWRA